MNTDTLDMKESVKEKEEVKQQEDMPPEDTKVEIDGIDQSEVDGPEEEDVEKKDEKSETVMKHGFTNDNENAEVEPTDALRSNTRKGANEREVNIKGKGFSSEIELLKKQIETKNREAEENFDRLLRLRAESENYKKRIVKEHNEFYKYAEEKLVRDLLVVADNIERAVDSADNNQGSAEALKKGFEIILNEFMSILKNAGLKQMESLNTPFDPIKHEAVSQVETDECESNVVVEEFQKGYFFKDRILRHSKVIVSKKPKPSEQEADK